MDTSFLSEFAKVEMVDMPVPHAGKWREFLRCLRHKVQQGLLLCPASEFQIDEVVQSPGILNHVSRLQYDLSKGHCLKHWMDILVHQAATQLLIYLKRPQHIDLSWRVLTRAPLCAGPAELVEAAKELTRNQASGLAPYESYAKQYEAERNSFVEQSFLEPATALFTRLLQEAFVSDDEVPRLLPFLKSNSVDRIQYLHIFCSINASLRFHEKKRRPRGSDLLDIAALACAMPYCHMVTTDINMRTQVVKRLGLNTHYGTRLFTGTPEDLDSLADAVSAIGH